MDSKNNQQGDVVSDENSIKEEVLAIDKAFDFEENNKIDNALEALDSTVSLKNEPVLGDGREDQQPSVWTLQQNETSLSESDLPPNAIPAQNGGQLPPAGLPSNDNPYQNSGQLPGGGLPPNGNPYQNGGQFPGVGLPPNGNPYQNGGQLPGTGLPPNGNPYQSGGQLPGGGLPPNGNPYQNGGQLPGTGLPPNGNPYQNGGYYQNGMQYPLNQPYVTAYQRPNGFVSASMAMGIIAIVSAVLCTVYPPLIFGGLSIIFALLSKGGEKKLHPNAKTGLTLAIIGFTLNLIIVGFSFAMVFSNPAYMEQFKSMYEDVYGVPFDQSMDDAFGDL